MEEAAEWKDGSNPLGRLSLKEAEEVETAGLRCADGRLMLVDTLRRIRQACHFEKTAVIIGLGVALS